MYDQKLFEIMLFEQEYRNLQSNSKVFVIMFELFLNYVLFNKYKMIFYE